MMDGRFQRHVCARGTHDYMSYRLESCRPSIVRPGVPSETPEVLDSDGDGETRRNRTGVYGVRPGRAAARHRLHILITTLHWYGCSDT